MKSLLSNTSISGTVTFCENPVLFSFRPNHPIQGKFKRYRKQGTALRCADGSFEFVERDCVRSRAELIKLLSHGRLTKTVAGDFLLTIRVPQNELRVASIIASDSVDAINAIQNYLFVEEAA